jgi:hypothetical protein
MDQVSGERSSMAAPSMLFEAMAGVGAIVLAILGLTRILPHYMAAIGTIVVGAALVEGSALGVRSRRVTSAMFQGQPSAEVLAGAAGVVLGVLALLGMSELVLLPVAVIVFGASLLIAGFSAPLAASIAVRRRRESEVSDAELELPGMRADDSIARALDPARPYSDRTEGTDRAAPLDQLIESPPTGAQLLVGLAAVVLGILALLGHSPMLLTLVALLCLGCMELLSGSVLGP